MANVWDALKDTAKGFTEGYKQKMLAETKMKSELETGLLMAKMKSMWDLEAKKEEKKLTTPYEDMMMEEWKSGQVGAKGEGGTPQGTMEITPGARGFRMKTKTGTEKHSDLFRNDFKNAVSAYNKIKTLSLSPDEIEKRKKMVLSRMLEAYPTESQKIRSYFDMAELDQEMQ